jgi:hypothetical protein
MHLTSTAYSVLEGPIRWMMGWPRVAGRGGPRHTRAYDDVGFYLFNTMRLLSICNNLWQRNALGLIFRQRKCACSQHGCPGIQKARHQNKPLIPLSCGKVNAKSGKEKGWERPGTAQSEDRGGVPRHHGVRGDLGLGARVGGCFARTKAQASGRSCACRHVGFT